jgi:hypothetical protein
MAAIGSWSFGEIVKAQLAKAVRKPIQDKPH